MGSFNWTRMVSRGLGSGGESYKRRDVFGIGVSAITIFEQCRFFPAADILPGLAPASAGAGRRLRMHPRRLSRLRTHHTYSFGARTLTRPPFSSMIVSTTVGRTEITSIGDRVDRSQNLNGSHTDFLAEGDGPNRQSGPVATVAYKPDDFSGQV